jgi:hypothetical protein
MTNPLQFKPVLKDRLFFEKYRYSVSFLIDEASALILPFDQKELDANLDKRYRWREEFNNRWRTSHGYSYAPSWAKPITSEIRQNLHTVADILRKNIDDIKISTSICKVWIYSNNLKLIENLNQLDCVDNITLTEAVPDRPKNTIRVKNSKYTHRSYLKRQVLSNNEKLQLVKFFDTHFEQIRLSPELTNSFYRGEYHHIAEHYFIDYTGESWLTMLMLTYPGIVRKTLTIIPA